MRVVVFNVFGHLNMGDALLLEALVDSIRKASPAASLSGIAFDPETQRGWMPEIEWAERVGNRPHKNGQTRSIGNRIWQAWALLLGLLLCLHPRFYPLRLFLPQGQRKAIELLEGCDLAISCPGGYLEDSNHAYLLNGLQLRLARTYASSVVMAPQSIGPIRSAAGARWIGSSLVEVDRIFVRDDHSLEFIGRHAKQSLAKVQRTGDLALIHSPRSYPDASLREAYGFDGSRKVVGMTMINWDFPGSEDARARKENYVACIRETIARLVSTEIDVVVFNQVDFDLAFIREALCGVDGVVIDQTVRSTPELCALISHCDLFIGSRMHSCAFAILGNVPTIGISYLPKMDSLFQDLGLPDLCISIDQVSSAQIARLAQDALRDGAPVRARLSEGLRQHHASVKPFLACLDACLGPKHG
jgi:colanic acid/amylovoran biosynthesis protein